ncbi:hypothetical protein, partial [Microcystis aeruginosa]|uniref:hypothetical protein n=1 Tax=Microcystis aeruginosa TaxID=1126 RepID=UPI0018AD10ED
MPHPQQRTGGEGAAIRTIEAFDTSENCQTISLDILAAVKRTAIPHHATFLGWSLNGVDAS